MKKKETGGKRKAEGSFLSDEGPTMQSVDRLLKKFKGEERKVKKRGK